MPTTKKYIQIIDALGNVQAGLNIGLHLWNGSNYPVTPTVSAITDDDGSVNLSVSTTGYYKTSINGILKDNQSDELIVCDDFYQIWNTVNALKNLTATATELNVMDGVVAGIVTAGKGVIAGTGKSLDELDISTLKIDGTTVTSIASELNILTGTTVTNSELQKLAGLTGNIITTTSNVFTDLSALINTVISSKSIDLASRYKSFQIDCANKTGLTTGTYKTVEVMAVKGGNFMIESILVTDYTAGSYYVTAIQINKKNQAGVSTTLKDVTLSSYTTLGDVKYIKDNFNFITDTISGEDLIEVKVKINSGTTANTKITIFYRLVTDATTMTQGSQGL